MPKSIGEQLRDARTKNKLSLEDASRETYIRRQYLDALENDQFELLPSPAQGRGFLRLYASWLKINVEPLLEAWVGKPAIQRPVLAETKSPTIPLSSFSLTAERENSPSTTPEFPDATASIQEKWADERSDQGEIGLELTSDDLFQAIGQLFRLRREALGINLEDVEKFAHLRLKYLEVLEAGRLDELPSTVQGRGLLGHYARFLDLDTEDVLSRFSDALQKRRLERMPAAPTENESPKKSSKFPLIHGWRKYLTTDLILGGTVILVLIGFALWSTSQVIAMRGTHNLPVPPSISQVLISTPDLPLITITKQSETASSNLISRLQTTQTIVNNGPTDTPAALLPVSDAPVQLYVIAHQRAWMQVMIGRKVVFNGRTNPGDAYPFTGTAQIELVTGNAAALQIYYNQKDLGPLGQNGEVFRLVFTPKGILTPTAMFSPSPTATQRATLTLQPTPTKLPLTITPPAK